VIDLMFDFDISLLMFMYVDYYYKLLIVFMSLITFNVFTHCMSLLCKPVGKQIMRGDYRIVESYINVNMVINTYEYVGGGKYVYMFRFTYAQLYKSIFILKCKTDIGVRLRVYMLRYTYAGIREMSMHMEKEDRHRSRVVCIHV